MIKNISSQAKTYLCVCLLLLFIACNPKKETYKNVSSTDKQLEELYEEFLSNAIQNLDGIEEKSLEQMKTHYVEARKNFKLLEPCLLYTSPSPRDS